METDSNFLPDDRYAGTLVGRAWLPGPMPGPAVVAICEDGVYDLSSIAATMSTLLERGEPATLVRRTAGRRIGSVDEVLQNTTATPDETKPYLLAPCDLQVIKAAGQPRPARPRGADAQ